MDSACALFFRRVATALRAAERLLRVSAALRPAERLFRVSAALRPAARSLRVLAALRPAARLLRVIAALRAASLARWERVISDVIMRSWFFRIHADGETNAIENID